MEKSTAHNLVLAFAVLIFISAALLAISGLALLFAGSPGTLMNIFAPVTDVATAGVYAAGVTAIVMAIIMLLLAVIYLVIGIAIWKHKPWARMAAIVLSVISLFGFPLGTIIGIFGIWLFGFNRDVKEMFSTPEYGARTTAAAARRR